MAKIINTKIDDGILIFTFTNNEDEVFSSFKLNPTDINVAARAEELTEYFEQLKDSIQKVTSGKEMAELNKQIEDKINYLLGYEASKDLFKEPITATTVFAMVRYSPISFWIRSQKQSRRKLKREKRKCRQQSISIRRSMQMTAYELPTSLNISGVDFSIRTDFRAIIDILIAMNDPELDEQAKAVVMLQILFEDWQSIPAERLDEACQKASEFIDCGQSDDNPNHSKPRLMDWEQDGDMIVPAVNKVAGKEIRAVPYMHWWTFFGYFMESGECLFNTVVGIRSKKAKGEKLDKWEKKFYQENKNIIDIKTRLSEEEQAYKDALNEMLNLK